ncbi:MAG: DUF2892 domain-containing protein [Candidatus Nanohaloarchaea archaeon]|nr:DUF2892 domain-containing protein [Candidatus Nanohaloarchaea archaeon]
MKHNVGGMDRTGRLIVGTVLLIAGLAAATGRLQMGVTVGAAGIVIGTILIGTGATQTCPIYAVAGLDTSEEEE